MKNNLAKLLFVIMIMIVLFAWGRDRNALSKASSYPNFWVFESGWTLIHGGQPHEFYYGWQAFPDMFQVYVTKDPTNDPAIPYQEWKTHCVEFVEMNDVYLEFMNRCKYDVYLKGAAIHWGLTP